MEISTVRNAIVTQLKTDTDIIAAFTTPPATAVNVDYGLPRNVAMTMLPKSIRVVQMGRGLMPNDAEIEAEFSGDYNSVWENYRFHVVATFAEDNEKDAEDSESNYDRLIRKALSSDYSLGNVVTDINIGRTFFRTHPEKTNIHFVIVEVSAKKLTKAETR